MPGHGDGEVAGASPCPAPPPGLAGVRARFSSLQDDFVYLDAPGGTQTPDEVAEAVAAAYRDASGNTGAPYAASRRIEEIVDDARAASARFLGCSADKIIFGPNMTSLNYTMSRTLGRELRAGDEIVVTRLDHDANVAPWLDLARDIGLRVRLADVRIGIAHYNTMEEMDRFNEALAAVVAEHSPAQPPAAGQPG